MSAEESPLYEYWVFQVASKHDLQDVLDARAAEGWRLVSVCASAEGMLIAIMETRNV